jgi:cephalosporin hydroxylase
VPDELSQPEVDEIVDRFHNLYYNSFQRTHVVHWLGARMLKCPLDLWIYQEILHDKRPDVIVETGSGRGGSSYYMASIFDLLEHDGRIISIDAKELPRRATHPRVTFLTGSSADPAIIAQVRDAIAPDETVMVILDSDHRADHVLAELHAYAPLVSEGHYLIVEDTNVNGHPVYPEHGPGPTEALQAFLAEPAGADFEVDRECERFFLTMHPGGYLRRRQAAER